MDSSPIVAAVMRVTLLLFAFMAVDLTLIRALRLPAPAFESPFLLTTFVSNMHLFGLLALLLALFLSAMAGWRIRSWNQLDLGSYIRWFILFLALLIVWFVGMLPFNHYFNQGYTLDKAILFILFVLLVWRPVFILPFLVVSFLLFWQLTQPVLNNGSHLAHKIQILHVLNLFAAWFLLHSVAGKQRATDFLLLTACLIAAAYWIPVLKKLFIGWLHSGELNAMLLNAHAHGWLSHLDASTIVDASLAIATIDFPMRIFVFVIEAGCLILLWRRSYAVLILACLTLFHAGVFLLFGYLFWTWMALNLAFIVLLLKLSKHESNKLFTKPNLIIGVVLILTGNFWCSPAPLAWIDGRISYTYRYEAIGDSGVRYQLPFSYFEPYGDVFTMANFAYLVEDHQMLAYPYGSTSSKRADALMHARNLADVEQLENTLGWSSYDTGRRERFEQFITRFMRATNDESRFDQYNVIRPPRQFWTHARGNVYELQEPIHTVIVKEVTTLFDGVDLNEIRNNTVMTIDIQ